MKPISLLSALLSALLAVLPTVTLAADNSSSATFIYNSTLSSTLGNALVFSINTVQSTGDVYFHMEAPASGDWVAVGFGGQMAGSLMLVAYPSSNGSGITISPRIANGHSEPTTSSDMTVEKVWDTGLITPNTVDHTKQIMYIDGVCRGCVKWSGGSIDLTNSAAPFIFAVGPGLDLDYDALDAPMSRHSFYGHFTMDMKAATSQSQGVVPRGNNGVYVKTSASDATGTSSDRDIGPRVHAFLMIVTFILIFPIGSLILRIFNKVIMHAVVQGIGMLLVVIGFAMGAHVGSEYNRTKSFQSGHQIFGVLIFIGLLLQLGFGIINHRVFKKTQRGTIVGKIHVFLGPALIILAIINGALGFRLANETFVIVHYIIGIIIIAIIFIIIRFLAQRCMRRRKDQNTQYNINAASANGDYQRPQFVPNQSYGEPHTQNVPLRPYHSTESVPQVNGPPPQYPRPMV